MRKRIYWVVLAMAVGFAQTATVALYGINHNQLKYLRLLQSRKDVFRIGRPLQEITVVGSGDTEADLRERLAQCSVLLGEYDQLLEYIGEVLEVEGFQLQHIVDAIYRLKDERDEARVILEELANFAEINSLEGRVSHR